jgi:predicted O-methyltransferase YrrM
VSLAPYRSYPDKRIASQAVIGAAIAKTGSRFLRKRIPPSLRDLVELAGHLHADPERLLDGVPWLSKLIPSGRRAQLAEDHAKVRADLAERYRALELALPPHWAVEEGTSFLLYALVRELTPSAVVEVGVGNGHSSLVILRALQRNEMGVLYSFDIEQRAGGLVAEEERDDWVFSLVSRKRSALDLRQQLERAPRADLCFHDAGHAYLSQYFDFAALWERLSDVGVMVCDDVDASYAMIDFSRLTGARPEILIDARKAVALLPGPGRS